MTRYRLNEMRLVVHNALEKGALIKENQALKAHMADPHGRTFPVRPPRGDRGSLVGSCSPEPPPIPAGGRAAPTAVRTLPASFGPFVRSC